MMSNPLYPNPVSSHGLAVRTLSADYARTTSLREQGENVYTEFLFSLRI
jgi:hypothetical protein